MIRYLFCLVLFTAPDQALPNDASYYEHFQLENGKRLKVETICPGIKLSVLLSQSLLTLTSEAGHLRIKNDLELDVADIIVGDFWRNGHCFLAVETAHSNVNRSYDVYEIARSSPPRRVESFPGFVNPEFEDGFVASTYRDAARWHREKACFPPKGSPYICERADSLDDTIERIRQCKPTNECTSPSLAYTSSRKAVTAVISSRKALILREQENGQLETLRSYLVKGDRVKLLDFKDEDASLFYRFEYHGRNLTVGWLRFTDIQLESDHDSAHP